MTLDDIYQAAREVIAEHHLPEPDSIKVSQDRVELNYDSPVVVRGLVWRDAPGPYVKSELHAGDRVVSIFARMAVAA